MFSLFPQHLHLRQANVTSLLDKADPSAAGIYRMRCVGSQKKNTGGGRVDVVCPHGNFHGENDHQTVDPTRGRTSSSGIVRNHPEGMVDFSA